MCRFGLMLALAVSLSGAGALAQSAPTKPPNPSELPIQEAFKTIEGDTIGLSTCFAKADIITCKFVLTRNAPGATYYSYDPKFHPWNSTLFDNFKIEHQLVDGYLLNGRNEHVKRLNIETGESFVFSQDYGGAKTNDVDQIRIMFNPAGQWAWPTYIVHGILDASQ